jgi:hypothetical protein
MIEIRRRSSKETVIEKRKLQFLENDGQGKCLPFAYFQSLAHGDGHRETSLKINHAIVDGMAKLKGLGQDLAFVSKASQAIVGSWTQKMLLSVKHNADSIPAGSYFCSYFCSHNN